MTEIIIWKNPNDFTIDVTTAELNNTMIIDAFTIDSENLINKMQSLKVVEPNTVTRIREPEKHTFKLPAGSRLNFILQPNSELTLTLYMKQSFFQRIKNFFS